ncbi:hypothetical protein DLM85_11865 [Hymenobacter edaphi]|uniref:Uncharacterized protein n=1 Tax=Hymenobacter edaphi TaxID=2211146 RepID=A0A328BPD3_9BACT|nr:hypothetical protein DLM85_11865 [Hymenobacter edaphi]
MCRGGRFVRRAGYCSAPTPHRCSPSGGGRAGRGRVRGRCGCRRQVFAVAAPEQQQHRHNADFGREQAGYLAVDQPLHAGLVQLLLHARPRSQVQLLGVALGALPKQRVEFLIR